jgi:hypothetical protein
MTLFNPNAKFSIGSYPFNYLVVEELFHKATASNLNMLFTELMADAKKIGQVGEVGKLVYEALNFTPVLNHVRNTSIGAFVSAELREFIANVFRIRIDENVMIGMHRHVAPSKPGWAHTDFAVVSFPNESPNCNGVRVFYDGCGCNYSDDSRDRQPNSIKTARALACLYYVGNDTWAPNVGGDTGLYADLGRRLVKSIPPKNNSLLVFEISPISYHAYLGCETMHRNSFIWWYHSEPNYLLSRHSAAADYKRRCSMDPWDRWTEASVPKFETNGIPF